MPLFKATELDAGGTRPTGAVQRVEAPDRAAAAEALRVLLGATAAELAPGGSIVRVDGRLWVLTTPLSTARPTEQGHLRRGGPKHRH